MNNELTNETGDYMLHAQEIEKDILSALDNMYKDHKSNIASLSIITLLDYLPIHIMPYKAAIAVKTLQEKGIIKVQDNVDGFGNFKILKTEWNIDFD